MALMNLLDPGVAGPSQSFVSNGNTTSQVVCGKNFPSGLKTIACQVVATVATPANKVFASTAVNTGTSQVTVTAHGYLTGTAVTMTTTGSLPTGLATSTTYYLIVIDANTLQFASSLANALAGTAITLSAQGSGNDTINVTALASGSVKLQKSLDGTNWYDEGSAQTVSATGNFYFEKVDPCAKFYSILVALASGQINTTVQWYGKGIVG